MKKIDKTIEKYISDDLQEGLIGTVISHLTSKVLAAKEITKVKKSTIESLKKELSKAKTEVTKEKDQEKRKKYQQKINDLSSKISSLKAEIGEE
jgi:septal ring factor EnvC (AmiA/AmiB activator)